MTSPVKATTAAMMKITSTSISYTRASGWATLRKMSISTKIHGGVLSKCRSGSIQGILLLVIAAVAASGCVTTEPMEPPGVTLVDLDIVDATLFESTLDVAVRISNDNPEPLVIDGAVIKLELNGIKVGKGASDERLELPRLGSVVRRVELHMNHLALATRIKGIIEAKVLNYGVTGKVYVVRPSGSVRGMSFESRGQLDLRGEAAQSDALDAVPPETVD